MEGGYSKDELVEQIFLQRIKNQQAYREKLQEQKEMEELLREHRVKESSHE